MLKKLFGFLLFAFGFLFCLDDVSAQTLSDGVYKIRSAVANDKMIDLYGGFTTNNTNIQLWQNNEGSNQKWIVKHLSHDYYTIASYQDESMVMDVHGALKKLGTNVELFKGNGGDNQQWLIKYAGEGYYNIISKCNGLFLDVYGGLNINGANLQVWSGNNGANQKFKFVQVIEGSKTIEDGTYTISSGLDISKVIDVAQHNAISGANVELYENSDFSSQIWNVEYLNNGYYALTSFSNSSLSLDVYGAYAIHGTNVQLYNHHGGESQQWLIKEAGDGYYNIVSKLDHMYLDVAGGVSTNGTNIEIFQSNDGANQKFKFNKVDFATLEDGLYTINSALDENMVLGLETELAVDGANVQLENFNNSDLQKWYVEYLGQGYYKIISASNSHKALDVYGNFTSAGTNVQLFDYHNGTGQQWLIKEAGNGYYNIVSKASFLQLDVYGAIAEEGSNIQIWTKNDGANQKFKFESTTLTGGASKIIDDGYYTITSGLDSNKAIDVYAGIKKDGTNVQLFTLTNALWQTWYLKYSDDGYYTITSSMNPNIALSVYNSSMTSGANVEISRFIDQDNQKWAIRKNEDGYYTFISKVNGLALDASSLVNGANIRTYTPNNSKAQQFFLNAANYTKKYTGIDVSKYQEDIDWETLADSDLGFVIIRGGYGGNWTNQDDEKFEANVAACEKYNIPYGLYLYSYATDIENTDTSAVAEAEHMLRLIDKIKANNYTPTLGTKVFLDMEDKSTSNIGKDKLTQIADRFCSIIESKGYSCGIYANKTWLLNNLNAPELEQKYDIWLAEWPNNNTITSFMDAKNSMPTYNLTPYKYWQFTSNGTINGISGRVDLNLGYDIFD